VGKNVPDKDFLPIVVDHGNQPVVVTSNVENGPTADHIGRSKTLANLAKVTPVCSLCEIVPSDEGVLRIGMLVPKLLQHLPADDMHVLYSLLRKFTSRKLAVKDVLLQ
jgi:hypothetical protein